MKTKSQKKTSCSHHNKSALEKKGSFLYLVLISYRWVGAGILALIGYVLWR